MYAAIVVGARCAADACSAVNGKEVAIDATHQEGRRVRWAHITHCQAPSSVV